jgi:hypothetical protein
MESKDLFSDRSDLYAAFRPTYPEELYQFIFELVPRRETALDCATGNGQVARRLSLDFISVFATDISQKQLDKGHVAPNIFYKVARAEETPFSDDSFDLITVGQALHWFDLTAFYSEASRVGKPSSILAAWGYGNITINASLDPVINHFYSAVVGAYWDSARRHVESAYANLAFPFDAIKTPDFFIRAEWTINHLLGYLESWSATQSYIKNNGSNPVHDYSDVLRKAWGNEEKHPVSFPVFLKVGRITK